MRWALVLLLALPLVTAQVPSAMPEQPHVTLAPNGLVVHFAKSGSSYLSTQSPVVLASIEGGPEQPYPAALVGQVLPIGSSDTLTTSIYAATVPVEPGQTIRYRYGDALMGYGGPHEVRRPDNGPLHFVAVGDIGYEGVAIDGSQTPNVESPPIAVRNLAAAQNPELLLLPGDLSYDNNRAGWDRFMRMQAPLQATVPTMPAIGNHEWQAPIGYNQFLATYVLPEQEQDYTFKAGPVTFIVVNSDNLCEGIFGRSGAPLTNPCPNGLVASRMSFLEQALKDARTDDTPWTIVSMHHPPYSWGRHGNDWASHIYLTPLFEKYKVDLVITAHDHVYSRTHPIIKREAQATGNNYTQGTGPIYAVLGGGGRPLYQIPIDPPPAWLAMGESTYHLGIIDASNTTIDFRAIRLDGSTLDTFQIHVSDAAATAESTPTFAWSLLVAGLLALAVFVRRRGPS